MPNLENLKKQAKLILRWHRERHYPVAAQIRELMPRFLNMSDSEILAASFKLSDAQEMVAKQRGFDSWQTLKIGLSTTSQGGKWLGVLEVRLMSCSLKREEMTVLLRCWLFLPPDRESGCAQR
jgi:hypothetical protein